MKEDAPKVTLIKQPRPLKAEPSMSAAPVASGEKKRVFIKKKVVVLKQNKETVSSSPEEASVPTPTPVQPSVKPEPSAAPAARARTASAPPSRPASAAPSRTGSTAPSRTAPAASARTSPSASLDPLRNGPVIIRDANLPPINFKPNSEVPSSGGPRQMGVVGGRDFSGNRGRNGYQQRGNGRYPNSSGGNSYGNNNGGGNSYGNNNYGGNSYGNNGGGYRGNSYGNNSSGSNTYGNNYGNRPRNFGPRPPYGAGNGNSRPGGFRPYNNNGRPGFQNNRPGGGFGGRPRQGGFSGGAGGFRKPATSEETPIGKTKRDYSNSRKKENNEQEDSWESRRENRDSGAFQYRRKEAHSVSNAVPKSIDILENITVNDLAKKMNLKASEIISKCFQQGMMLTINQQIDSDTAALIAGDYGCEVHIVNLYDETVIPTDAQSEEDLEPRAPIVTVMGHVDHGKTKLLDAIRSTHVAEGEFGGITQHIGAYKVNIPEKGDIVFLDTPGHAAFTMMRARGAQITDIVVLVVAANDGVMPQTLEAIDHAKAAKVPIIVAINKCDLPEANPDRVMQQLTTHGLTPEEWGGNTLYCKISALKKLGINELLDTILLQAEMLDLKAVRNCRAEGKVLESRIDQGRGSVATILIKNGTLHEGDYYVVGIYPGRVRAMFDDRGNRIKEAGPSTPVEISGLSGLPMAGDPFQVTEDEKQARLVGNKRQELERLGQAKKYSKVTLDNLYEKIKLGEMKELNVIIKGDVQGSVEALQKALEELSNDEIKLSVIRASAGAIIENDITLASASENPAIVIGFNVRPTPKALQLAEQEKIDIRKYNVIYDAVDDIKAAMEGMLAPERSEVDVGTAEVRQVFSVPKVGIIAGSMVLSGSVKRNCFCRVIRDSIQLNKDLVKITSLKRFKDDAKEVAAGYECGIGIEGFDNLQVGDTLEFVEIKETKRTLEEAKGAKPDVAALASNPNKPEEKKTK